MPPPAPSELQLEITLGQASESHVYLANCTQCKAFRPLDLVELAARLGPDFPVQDLRTRLRCRACRSRQVIVAFVTKDFYRSQMAGKAGLPEIR